MQLVRQVMYSSLSPFADYVSMPAVLATEPTVTQNSLKQLVCLLSQLGLRP